MLPILEIFFLKPVMLCYPFDRPICLFFIRNEVSKNRDAKLACPVIHRLIENFWNENFFCKYQQIASNDEICKKNYTRRIFVTILDN